MEDNILKLTDYGVIPEGEYTTIQAEKDVRNDGKICAQTIEVGGHATFTDIVEASTVEINGDLTLVGILRADQIIVRGNVEVTGSIEAGELVMEGNCTLHDTVQASKITIKGNVTLDNTLIAEELNVAYNLDGKGEIEAGMMEVGGRIDYHGCITASSFVAKAYHRGYLSDLRAGEIHITHPSIFRHPTSLIYRDYFTVENVECESMYAESTGMSTVTGTNLEFAKRCIVEEVFYLDELTATENCRLEHVEKIEQ